MAQYPMSPHHSRMLLIDSNYEESASLKEATLTEMIWTKMRKLVTSDTQKSLDKQEKLRQKKLKEMARVAHAKLSNPSSDALTIAYALQSFELAGNPVEFC
ncbi:hypothetical protein HHK36_012356 [Tetracentron sinense]|uniref:Uncharacterized protein n=1 Tax=Tetracentron sinense TaxID=13715 RepID=A0A835DI12_TETSI|nr:hypothetical protein HHK36_012356 [Tetracentron sinense]